MEFAIVVIMKEKIKDRQEQTHISSEVRQQIKGQCCEKMCNICGVCSEHPLIDRITAHTTKPYWEERVRNVENFHRNEHSFGVGYINIKTGELK